MSFKMKSIIIPLILIILSSSVFAFGVTDWLEGPVQVAPGGTGKVTFELQNMNGEEDMIASYEILQGADIVSIGQFIESNAIIAISGAARIDLIVEQGI